MEGGRIFVKGSEAVAMGALDAGLKGYFGYPITPQNEIPEYMSKHLPEAGGAFVQAESEVASINMVLGAAAAGKRAMTSSSGPGISLMQECISNMAGGEVPCVIVNMMRGGPGVGDINTAQGDYFQSTRGGGHGDYRTPCLAPATCQEAYDMTREAFDWAFKYRTPVLVVGDAILGQMKEPLIRRAPRPDDPDEASGWRLGQTSGPNRRILRSLHLAEGKLAEVNLRLQEKYRDMRAQARAEEFLVDDAELVVVAFGSTGRIVKSAVRKLRAKGLKVGLLRPITLFPFPEQVLRDLAYSGKRFLTIEHNMGQMVEDVRLAVRGLSDSDFFGALPGNLPTPDEFQAAIERACAGASL
ncbi:3-methyl-2-oxobutanoate dehydrogenase subunit VorB [Fundidesulfovibrio terrae]|uniref:3-methyl-2-oxobutanoate dehydrogenase subunit VorB n=1 Tax=Fundidesulfovibrio terrae TaxID=2922866 RepID=UPI001FAEB891|nr:3-methyl-2-oxobutanoate dehydrogenase subunit VorB [Fundidesulfovibrio terrae]